MTADVVSSSSRSTPLLHAAVYGTFTETASPSFPVSTTYPFCRVFLLMFAPQLPPANVCVLNDHLYVQSPSDVQEQTAATASSASSSFASSSSAGSLLPSVAGAPAIGGLMFVLDHEPALLVCLFLSISLLLLSLLSFVFSPVVTDCLSFWRLTFSRLCSKFQFLACLCCLSCFSLCFLLLCLL